MSKVEITSPKTRVISWDDCTAIVKDGILSECTEIKLAMGLGTNPDEFITFACAIVAAMKDTASAPQRKPRKDKGIKRVVPKEVDVVSIRLGEAPGNTEQASVPSGNDPAAISEIRRQSGGKPKRTRKHIDISETNGIFSVALYYGRNGKSLERHGKTLKEAATFALEEAGLKVSALDTFEQTEEVKRLKEVLAAH